MRVHVLNYFEKSQLLNDMLPLDRTTLLEQLNSITDKCRDKLFEITQAKAQGKYFENTEYLTSLKKEIANFQGKISIIRLEKTQLDSIKKHNSQVDQFTQKFSDKDTLLNVVKDLEIFKENSFMPSQESYNQSLTKDEMLDQILYNNKDSMNDAEQELLFHRFKKYMKPVRNQR